VALATAGLGLKPLLVAGAAIAGMEVAPKKCLEIYESKHNWAAFMQRNNQE
jgi:hypothetical protein